MPSLRHAQAVVIPVLAGVMSLSSVTIAQAESASAIIAAADIGARGVVAQGYADSARSRVDRTVVTPFDSARRIVVRPNDPESAAAPDARPAAATATTGSPATGRFVDIGTLDLSAPPPAPASPPSGIVATEPFAAAPGAFVHVGSYDDPLPGGGPITFSPE